MVERMENKNVVEIVEAFLKSFSINRDDKILIKPNFVCMDSYPFITDRNLIEEVVKHLIDKGCKKIVVADSPSPDYSAVYNLDCNSIQKKNKMNEFHQKYRNTQCRNEELAYISMIEKQVEEYRRNLLRVDRLLNALKIRLFKVVKCDKKQENVGNSYFIPALFIYHTPTLCIHIN